jgi:ATP-dependent Clp protease protease subunit
MKNLIRYTLLICALCLNVQSLIVTLTKANHISIKNSISSSTASKFINDIEQLKNKNIYIYINSPGGSVLEGEKIIQYMEYKKLTNHTLLCIADKAYSMAFHIFQQCNFRYVLPSSSIMQHQMSLEISGSLKNIQNYINFIERINKRFINIESKKLNITKNEYKKRIESDWWLYGEEIIKEKGADLLLGAVGCHKELLISNTNVVVGTSVVIVSDCPLINTLS